MNTELQTYIEQLRKKGISDQLICNKLVHSGWNSAAIHDKMMHMDEDGLPEPPKPQAHQAVRSGYAGMWEGFEHVLMFLSLYFMSVALGMLLHEFVNMWFPDTAVKSVSSSIIRGAVAALIVTYPLFAYFYLDIIKRSMNNPAVKQLRSRKFFTYLTLVGAFLFGVGKIVQTIFTFLDGNITFNFGLHLLVTLSIIGVIFFRYLGEVTEDRRATA